MNRHDSYRMCEADELAAFLITLRVAAARNDDLSVVFAAIEPHPMARIGSLVDDVMCCPEQWKETGE